jgi:hypothetical protein
VEEGEGEEEEEEEGEGESEGERKRERGRKQWQRRGGEEKGREEISTSSVLKSDNLRLRSASEGSMAATFSITSTLSTLGLITSRPCNVDVYDKKIQREISKEWSIVRQ